MDPASNTVHAKSVYALFIFRITVVEANRRRDLYVQLIQPYQSEPGPKHSLKRGLGTHTSSKKRTTAFIVVALAVLVPLSVAHASFFAAIAGIFEEVPVETPVDQATYSAQSVPLLKAAIHTDPNPAKGGGDIVISEDGALVSGGDVGGDESVNKYTANGEISVYIVREGDTLSQIAEMFDVSANTILWANDIQKASLIKPGMTLVILPITGVRHVVKEGDTLQSIAKKYEGDVEEILAYNQLASASDIVVNETIVIPGGAVSAPKSSGSTATRSSSGSVAVSTGSGSSSFSHPLPGAVRTQGIHGYNGVDLAAGAGSAILAAAGGEVIVAKSSGWNGGYGNYVVIKHGNGTQTLYAHLSSVAVSVGEGVSAGEQVGVIGNTGRSTGIHLHFEVRGASNPF